MTTGNLSCRNFAIHGEPKARMEVRLETSDSTSVSCFMLSPELLAESNAAGSMLKNLL